MKIEIWSDVTCTHCYIAKRKFEKALSTFKDRDDVEISWRSFELAPGFKTDPAKLLPLFLQEMHGTTSEHVQDMINHVAGSARQVGLEYNLNQAIPANTFNAHRLSHFAKTLGLQEKMKERMFKAYFTEGKNIDDIPTLAALAQEIGLDSEEVKGILESTLFTDEVNRDLAQAREAGIASVPMYIFNGNRKVSGTQDSEVYLELLEKEFVAWQARMTGNTSDGTCKIGEVCN